MQLLLLELHLAFDELVLHPLLALLFLLLALLFINLSLQLLLVLLLLPRFPLSVLV